MLSINTQLDADQLDTALEIAFRVLRDGNLHEWVANELDLSDEALHPILERLRAERDSAPSTAQAESAKRSVTITIEGGTITQVKQPDDVDLVVVDNDWDQPEQSTWRKGECVEHAILRTQEKEEANPNRHASECQDCGGELVNAIPEKHTPYPGFYKLFVVRVCNDCGSKFDCEYSSFDEEWAVTRHEED